MKSIIYVLINSLLSAIISAKTIAKDEEIEVKLQFLEYELEDFCIAKNQAKWEFFNGSTTDLKKLLTVELKEAEFYKNELSVLQKHMSKKISNERLQRLIEIFSHPGAPLLGKMEFKEYREYSIKLQELLGLISIDCVGESQDLPNVNETSKTDKKCAAINYNKINKFLFEEKNERKLKHMWIKWYNEVREKNKKTKYDFVQQLSILDLEAEQNGEEELKAYWLKQSDITLSSFETAQNLWKEIQPLYEKLKSYMMFLIKQKFGEGVFHDKNLIPVHLLGSLTSYDWVTAAEKLGAFDLSDTIKSLRSSIAQKKTEELYRVADNLTAELKLGNLPETFYKKSCFNASSQSCQIRRMDHCERDNSLRVLFCAEERVSLKHYIELNEEVMKMKYVLLSSKEEEENGYLFREGPRESVLYEALGGLSSVRALWLENLKKQNLIPKTPQHNQEIATLLITALNVIPRLPYYLASDLWRINALQEIDAAVGESTGETTTITSAFSTGNDHYIKKRDVSKEINTNNNDPEETIAEEKSIYNASMETSDATKIYDTHNLTKDWWDYRNKFQMVKSPDGKLYEDYLLDEQIIWNKPYINKFLGAILQFQILEYVTKKNLTFDLLNLLTLMQKGKSKTWESLIEKTFNITEISTQPLSDYFKPLDEFLDKRMKLNQTQLFSLDDFISEGFSLDSANNEEQGEKPAEGSDALFFSLAVIAAVGLVALIVTIGRRRYKRKQKMRKRNRRLGEL